MGVGGEERTHGSDSGGVASGHGGTGRREGERGHDGNPGRFTMGHGNAGGRGEGIWQRPRQRGGGGERWPGRRPRGRRRGGVFFLLRSTNLDRLYYQTI